jgi:hypothetical protein
LDAIKRVATAFVARKPVVALAAVITGDSTAARLLAKILVERLVFLLWSDRNLIAISLTSSINFYGNTWARRVRIELT